MDQALCYKGFWKLFFPSQAAEENAKYVAEFSEFYAPGNLNFYKFINRKFFFYLNQISMETTARITRLFKDLFDGDPWLDVNLMSTMNNLTLAQVSTKIAPGRNSIWEIVNHVTAWRLNILERFKGTVILSPKHNFFLPVDELSEEAWRNSLRELEESQTKWIRYLESLKDQDLDKVYEGSNDNLYYHLHGIIQHDAYHLGQIVLLTKLL